MKKLIQILFIILLLPAAIIAQDDNSGTYINEYGQKIIVKEGDGGIFVTDGNQMNLFMTVSEDVYMNPFIGMTVLVYDDYIMFGNTNGQMFVYQKWIDYSSMAMTARTSAMELFQEGDWEGAIEEYETAIEYEKESSSTSNQMLGSDYQGIAVCNMGILMGDMSVDDNYNYVVGDTGPVIDNLNTAAEYYRKARERKLEAGCYIGSADFYKNLFDYENAIVYYKKAADIYENLDEKEYAVLVSNIAGCYSQLSDFEAANTYLNIGIRIMQENLNTKEDELMYGYVLNTIGNTNIQLGRYDDAIRFFDESLKIGKKYNDIPMIVQFHQNMSIVNLDMGQYDKAIQSCEEARKIIEQDTQNDTEPAFASIDLGMSHIYMSKGNWEDAENSLNSALVSYRNLEDVYSQVIVLIDLSSVYCEKKNYDLALESVNNALELCKEGAAEQFRQSNSQGVVSIVRLSGKAIQQLGYIYYLKGDYQKALEKLSGNLKMGENYNERRMLIASYSLLGMIYNKLSDYPNAVSSYNKSIELIREVRKSVNNPKTQRDYLETMRSSYKALTMIHYRNHDFTEAFNNTEKSSATVFGEQIAKKLGLEELPYVDLESFKQQLPSNEIVLKYQFCDKDTSLCLFITNGKIGVIEFSPQKLVNDTYKVIGNNVKTFELSESEIRGMMNQGSQSVVETLEEDNNSVKMKFEAIIKYYRYLITGQNTDIRGMVNTGAQNAKTTQTDFQVLSKLLYNHLIKPLESQLTGNTEIVILPEGILGFLPYETFLMPDNKYLCQKFNIRYQQSLAVADLISKREVNTDGTVLAVGGASYNQKSQSNTIASRSASEIKRQGYSALASGGEELTGFYDQYTWSDLPGTLAEATEIAQMQEGSKLITGAEASETTIKSLNSSGELGKYRFVHFATHGMVVPEVPELSALVLARGSDTQNDGYMNMNDIYDLNLKSELVNLSACETGLGKIYSGEGVVGLTQAFLLAGTQGVSVSLWSVEDQSTSRFMTEMYSKVFDENLDVSQAMNKTRNEFISGKYGELYKAPYYWAPFVYYGVTGNDKIVNLKTLVANLKEQNQSLEVVFNIGSAYLEMGNVSARQMDFEMANQYYLKAVDAFNEVYKQYNNDDAFYNVGFTFSQLADINEKSYQKTAALEYLQKSKEVWVSLYAKTKKEDYSGFITYLDNKINQLSVTNDEMIAQYQNRISILEKILLEADKQVAGSPETKNEKNDNNSPADSPLIGVWSSVLNGYDPPVRVTWCVSADGTSAYFFRNANATQFTEGTWTLSKKVLSEKYSDGQTGEGKINWLSDNQFELTILDNGNTSDKGNVRVYSRITDKKFEDEKYALGNYYGGLSWYFVFTREFGKAEQAARKSLTYGDDFEWVNTNLAHALLFQGKYENAKTVYLNYKDKPYINDPTKNYKYFFLKDFDQLEAEGITHPDLAKIRRLLTDGN